MGVSRDSEFREKNRENGAIPLRSRRCNRGRKPQSNHCEVDADE